MVHPIVDYSSSSISCGHGLSPRFIQLFVCLFIRFWVIIEGCVRTYADLWPLFLFIISIISIRIKFLCFRFLLWPIHKATMQPNWIIWGWHCPSKLRRFIVAFCASGFLTWKIDCQGRKRYHCGRHGLFYSALACWKSTYHLNSVLNLICFSCSPWSMLWVFILLLDRCLLTIFISCRHESTYIFQGNSTWMFQSK